MKPSRVYAGGDSLPEKRAAYPTPIVLLEAIVMRVSTLSKIGLAVFMMGMLPACGSDSTDENTDTAPSGTLEVFSWWVTGGEKAAFDALVDEFNSHYPNVEVVNASLDDAANARM